MSNLIKKIDKFMPFIERLSKIRKLFSSSTTFWTVIRILMPFLISELIALSWNQKFSEIILSLVKNSPSWIQAIAEILIAYFEKSANPWFIWIILFIIVLMVFVKILDKEERTRHGLFFLTAIVLIFLSVVLFIFPYQSNDLKNISDKQDKILKDKRTEKYLIERIEKLEAILQHKNSEPHASLEELSKLNEQLIILKSKLYALQIDDKVINEAQAIIDKEQKEGVHKALELIEQSNSNEQLSKLREQNNKQAKISRYKAGLYEWIHQWEKANTSYQEAIEFNANFNNYFDYAYFLLAVRQNIKKAEKYYFMTLNIARNDEEKIKAYFYLANIHLLNTKEDIRSKAKEELEKVLKLSRSLSENQPEKYKTQIAFVLHSLGNFYSLDDTKYDKAKEYYTEAFNIFEEEGNLLGYVGVLESLSALYNNHGLDVSDIMEEVINVYRKLVIENKKEYLPKLALSLMDYGFYLKNQPQREKIELLFFESLKYYRFLVQNNAERHNPNLARLLTNLANFHFLDKEKMVIARDEYREALNIYRKLAEKEPNIFKKDLGLILNNLILVDLSFDDILLAKEDYREAYTIRKSLAEENPKAYGFDYAHTLIRGVAFFDESIINLEEASKYLKFYDKNYKDIQFLKQEIKRLTEVYIQTNL